MNILAFTDLHSSQAALNNVMDKAKHADMIACAGDISSFETDIEKIVAKLARLSKPMVIIAGNHESSETIKMLSRIHQNMINLDMRHYKQGDCLFMGCSGNGFIRHDPQFEKCAADFHLKMIKDMPKKSILLTHAAPYDTRLDKIGDSHNGNYSIRHFIERAQPDIAICGHFHENDGMTDRIGKTMIINPGQNGTLIRI